MQLKYKRCLETYSTCAHAFGDTGWIVGFHAPTSQVDAQARGHMCQSLTHGVRLGSDPALGAFSDSSPEQEDRSVELPAFQKGLPGVARAVSTLRDTHTHTTLRSLLPLKCCVVSKFSWSRRWKLGREPSLCFSSAGGIDLPESLRSLLYGRARDIAGQAQ